MSEPTQILTEDEARELRAVVGYMIPASAAHDTPGADDDAIFADICTSLGRDAAQVRVALAALTKSMPEPIHKLNPAVRAIALERFRFDHPALARAFETVTARCYYRDDRVMRAIGMEPRSPFPKGFEMPDSDWSLLDPVRGRGKMYRDA